MPHAAERHGWVEDESVAGRGARSGGEGTIPNITPHEEGLSWSQAEIAETLKSGFTPDFDTLGGRMASVQEELSHLPDADLQAIGAYLKAVPALPDAVERADVEQ
jgi:hypothetical protein